MTELAPIFAQLGIPGLLALIIYSGITIIGKRMGALERSNIYLAKAQLLTLVSLGQLDHVVKNQAGELLKEISKSEYEQRGREEE